MDHGTIAFSSLLIITLLAAFVPIIITKSKYFQIPIVVGEIVAGMIVGKSGFNLIQESSWLNFLYTFGFAFLMFLSGLEVDFDLMKSSRSGPNKSWYKKPLALAFFVFSGTLLLGSMISYVLKQFDLILSIPLMTLILSTTSLGIVVPTLKEKGMLNSELGQTVLLSALVADFATMVMVTIYVSFYTSRGAYEVLLVLLLFVFFFIFYKMGLRVAGNSIIEDLAHATSQIKVRGAFALILIFIALAQMLGSEIILGTFLAGLIISLIDRKDSHLPEKLDAIGYGFFIPIFFIMVGANFDIAFVLNNPKAIYLVPVLLISAYAVKIVPALILRINFPWKDCFSSGFLLSSRLSLIIATSEIGLKLNIITKETNGAIILVALMTCTLSPMLYNKLAPPAIVSKEKNIYMIGVKQKTLLLANRLHHSGMDITFITHNPEKYEKSLQQNYRGYLGDPLDVDFLKTTEIKDANVVVISKNDDVISTELSRICKEEFGIEHIMLLDNHQSSLSGENLHGATIISDEFATVFMAEHLILHPKTFSLLFERDKHDFNMVEIYLKNPRYFDASIRTLDLPGDCLILSIIRNEEKIIPHGNNFLRKGDLIMLVGSKDDVKQATLLLTNNL